MKQLFTLFCFSFPSLLFAQGKFFGGNADGFSVASINNQVLPLMITDLEARWELNTITLTATVTSDAPVCSMVIERSSNGNSFSAIDTVFILPPRALQAEQFSIQDEKPINGNNYYRLRVLDCDAGFALSEIILVSRSFIKTTFYSSSDRRLYYSSDQSEILYVFNCHGQLVLKKYLPAGTGSVSLQLFTNAVYFYVTTNNAKGRIIMQ